MTILFSKIDAKMKKIELLMFLFLGVFVSPTAHTQELVSNRDVAEYFIKNTLNSPDTILLFDVPVRGQCHPYRFDKFFSGTLLFVFKKGGDWFSAKAKCINNCMTNTIIWEIDRPLYLDVWNVDCSQMIGNWYGNITGNADSLCFNPGQSSDDYRTTVIYKKGEEVFSKEYRGGLSDPFFAQDDHWLSNLFIECYLLHERRNSGVVKRIRTQKPDKLRHVINRFVYSRIVCPILHPELVRM